MRNASFILIRIAFAIAVIVVTIKSYAQTSNPILIDSQDYVVLNNGIVYAKIAKSSAHIISYRYKGFDMLNDGYFSMDGGKAYSQPSHCRYSIKTNNENLVDVSFKSVWQPSYRKQAFDIDIHYVLQKGCSGIYSYAILNHPSNYPTTSYGEWRMVWKLNADLFDRIMVDSLRNMEMPTIADLKAGSKTPIPEATFINTGVKAGQYECKYNYSVAYQEVGTFGHASNKNKVGAWMVLGGYDYFNDGSLKQDLSAATGINHLHFGRNHYGGSGCKADSSEQWSKIYGPFLLYVNSKDAGADAMWTDAKQQVEIEKAKWPYKWLTETPDYPLADNRGNISGDFTVIDAYKPAVTGSNAWIGLTESGINWQYDSKNYQYWIKTDAKGKFNIQNIRPGTYTLHAFLDGEVGEFTKDSVVVKMGNNFSTNKLLWNIPRNNGKLVWEIGIPNRTAREFKYGDVYWNPFMWKTYSANMPNPLVYTIGKSNWRKDFNYVQSSYGTDDKMQSTWPWIVQFDLKNEPTKNGDAILTIAFAGTQEQRLAIYLNDSSKALMQLIPPTNPAHRGNALVRQGIHEKYCYSTITIPTAQLHKGSNFLKLVATRGGRSAYIIYDYLSLEVPE